MTGSCYDGSTNYPWNNENAPYGGNLDVYDIASLPSNASLEGQNAFECIDETLYGQTKFETLKEKVDWVCSNFYPTLNQVEDDETWKERVSKLDED